jgi:hypothetical protein
LSNIRAGAISGINGTDPVTLTKQSAAKAWGQYNQKIPVLNDSFNVSSFVDVGSGNGRLVFTSNMNSGDYAQTALAVSAGVYYMFASTDSTASNRCGQVAMPYSAVTSLVDPSEMSVTVHGDLA